MISLENLQKEEAIFKKLFGQYLYIIQYYSYDITSLMENMIFLEWANIEFELQYLTFWMANIYLVRS